MIWNLRVLASVNIEFGLWSIAATNPERFDETGLMENVQAILLAAAVAVLLRRAAALGGAARTAAIGFAFVCFCVCFREVDLRTLPVPDWAIWLTTGKVRNRLFIGIALAFGAYLLLRRGHLPPIIRQLLSRDARPLQVAIAMVVFATILEEIFYHTRVNKFWEENVETLAYAIVLHAALSSYWIPRGARPFAVSQP